MRYSRFGLCALVLSLPLACKTDTQSALKSEEPVASEAADEESFARQILKDGIDENRIPVLRPSEVWRRVEAGGSSEEAEKLLAQLLVKLFNGQERKLVKAVIAAGMGPAADTAAAIDASAGPMQDIELQLLAHNLVAVVSAHPEILDTLTTIEMPMVPALQNGLFNQRADATESTNVKPYMVTASPLLVDLARTDCVAPKDRISSVVTLKAGELLNGRPVITDGIDACFHDNSAALALALNLVANNAVVGDQNEIQINTAAGSTSIRDYQSLLAALQAGGYTIELYTTRVFVEFDSLLWKDHSGVSSIQLNTWIAGHFGPQTVRASAEHGEVGMMVRKGSMRAAQVRWYLGLPNASFPGQAAMWRPHPEKNTPWIGTEHEIVEIYRPDDSTEKALDWFVAGAHLMNAFQAVNVAFHPPYNSYGMLVCTDSLAALLAKLAELRGTKERLTEAFPIIRVQVNVNSGGVEMPLDKFIADHAAMQSDILASVFPSDTTVALDPSAWKARLGRAFPDPNDARYRYYPEFKSDLTSIIHR